MTTAPHRPRFLRSCTGALLFAALMAPTLTAQEVAELPPGTHASVNHQPLQASPLHLGLVRALVEAELANTVNVAMPEPLPERPAVTIAWPYAHELTIHAAAGDSEVAMVGLELQDFGPGPDGIGDILVLAIAADGARYRCEKYSPEFCDSVHSIVRYQIAK
jgi:hypothetical protein